MDNWRLKAEPCSRPDLRTWRLALFFALPIVALVLYLFYTWFAVRNRYEIFLYFHRMGPGFDTTPFGWVTASRYWMSGLVAAGAVMVPYIAANLVLGRVVRGYRAPVWWRVWILCAIPLAIAVPAIVMTVNDPVLPPANALQVTAALLAGLALAVGLGEYATQRPVGYMLLLVDGVALVCLLTALSALEDAPRWLARGGMGVVYRFLAVLAAGVGLLAVMTALYAWWRRVRIPGAGPWLVAGLDVMYLFLPLYHHLCWCKDDGSWTDPDYFSYIPDADNYFARNVALQIGVWVAAALVALGVTRLRVWLRRRRMARHERPALHGERA